VPADVCADSYKFNRRAAEGDRQNLEVKAAGLGETSSRSIRISAPIRPSSKTVRAVALLRSQLPRGQVSVAPMAEESRAGPAHSSYAAGPDFWGKRERTTLLNSWFAVAGAGGRRRDRQRIRRGSASITPLIASSNDNTIELSTGCLCCTGARRFLVDTMREADRSPRERRGACLRTGSSSRTTGLADPAPVIQGLDDIPGCRGGFVCARWLTTVRRPPNRAAQHVAAGTPKP